MESVASIIQSLVAFGDRKHPVTLGRNFKSWTSTGVIPLGKELTHNCFSRLRSINDYSGFDCGW